MSYFERLSLAVIICLFLIPFCLAENATEAKDMVVEFDPINPVEAIFDSILPPEVIDPITPQRSR
jgi:hypothetical protein